MIYFSVNIDKNANINEKLNVVRSTHNQTLLNVSHEEREG